MNSLSTIPIDEHGSYRTPDGAGPTFMGRRFPSIMFYVPCLGVVFRASRMAGREAYGYREWYYDSASMLRFLEQVGVKVEIEGIDHLASVNGPCVVVANHMSTLETFVLPSVIGTRKEHTYIVKKSLTTYPVFGPVMRSRNPVAVGRVNPREDLKTVLEDGAARLSEGVSIVVFPQTTRSYDFDVAEFNSIGIKLARRAGVQVVPLALRTDAWRQGGIVKDLGRIEPGLPVRFAFGEPLKIEGRGDEEHRLVTGFIASKLRDWGIAVKD
jgi:1-acyl-sn-glycerol-3-phosphate acyltransferase